MTPDHWHNLSTITTVGDSVMMTGMLLTQDMYDTWPFVNVSSLIIETPSDTCNYNIMASRMVAITKAWTIWVCHPRAYPFCLGCLYAHLPNNGCKNIVTTVDGMGRHVANIIVANYHD